MSSMICQCNGKHMRLVKTEQNECGVTWRTYVCNDCGVTAYVSDVRTINKKYKDIVRDLPPDQRKDHNKWIREEIKRLNRHDRVTKDKEKKDGKRDQRK